MCVCMSVPGNDFIPHLPTLDINEGGLNQLFQIYKVGDDERSCRRPAGCHVT